MKNWKSILALLLAVVMTVALMSGCGPKTSVAEPTEAPAEETEAPAEETEAPAEEPEAPAEEPEAPAEEAEPEAEEPEAPAEAAEGGAVEADLPFAEGTVLRMATGYNSTKTGLTFDAETAGDGITLADGKTYNAGDLKPTWVEIENILGITIEDKYQGNSASNEFDSGKSA